MDPLPFLDQTIKFLDGTSYERLSPPITDFRQCHGVTPPERRVLYRCRRLSPSPSSDQPHPEDQEQLFILKLKVQIPEPTDVNQPAAAAAPPPPTSNPTQSDATAHELSALQIFRDAGTDYGPRLVDFDSQRQGPEGLLPGGYISCTVMSTIPGKSLFDLGYWSLEADDRAEIQERFLEALSAVRKLGVEPGDKGLRNVMWDSETKRCGLVDFEMWQPYAGDVGDSVEERTEELQRWGLAHRPPAKNWWAEFGIKTC